jgi:hypothetical protein
MPKVKTHTIHVDGDTAIITHRSGKIVRMNTDKLHLIEGRSLYVTKSRGKWYAYIGVKHANGSAKSKPLHQLIMATELALNPGKEVDHMIDSLDNRTAMLRVVDRSTNVGHRPNRDPRNTSGYRGVHLHPTSKRWVAQLNYRGEKLHLGYHDTPIEAAITRDHIVCMLRQDDTLPSILNFPCNWELHISATRHRWKEARERYG